MTPLGWGYAALVWGYALVWFVVTDRVKLLGYRVLDPSGAPSDTSRSPGLAPGPTWPRWSRASRHFTRTSTPARASRCTTTPASAPTAGRSTATATHWRHRWSAALRMVRGARGRGAVSHRYRRRPTRVSRPCRVPLRPGDHPRRPRHRRQRRTAALRVVRSARRRRGRSRC